MSLFSLLDVNLCFGGPAILDKVNFQVDPGERVCLLGRNGAGKSTLMAVIAGEVKPDTGDVFRQPGSLFARLTQEVPTTSTGRCLRSSPRGCGPRPGHEEDWERDVLVHDLIDHLQLSPEARFPTLSGGLKRRALLGRALAAKPDLLLLDEPTNHLDLDSILWLEEFLISEKITLFFVTHDRAFLRRLATRIVELDRGRLAGWACDYDTYLIRKEEVVAAEEKQQAAFDKKLAQEEVWIRKGVRAQRSRAQGRIHALMKMRAERAARAVPHRQRQPAPLGGRALRRQGDRRRGHVLLLSRRPGARPGLHDHADPRRQDRDHRAERLRQVDAHQAPPRAALADEGQDHPRHAARVHLLRPDARPDRRRQDRCRQHRGRQRDRDDRRAHAARDQLPPGLPLHPDRARTPARVLSGGERNRLLLARLFTKPANVLVMDEPTNDLDAETLDLLEDLLVEYQGTLLIVSHDRDFLDNVVTSTLVFEGDGVIGDYVGGYADCVRERQKIAAAKAARARRPRRRRQPLPRRRSPRGS
jgi:ATP-binding cassette subfamily F protein uup